MSVNFNESVITYKSEKNPFITESLPFQEEARKNAMTTFKDLSSCREINIYMPPNDVIFEILSHLQPNDLYQASMVCKTWYAISQRQSLIAIVSRDGRPIIKLLRYQKQHVDGFENWHERTALINRAFQRRARAQIPPPLDSFSRIENEVTANFRSPSLKNKAAAVGMMCIGIILAPVVTSLVLIHQLSSNERYIIGKRKDQSEEEKDLKLMEQLNSQDTCKVAS